jgi:DNA helicase-2/ATP-dependent DNA helicase PcrA
VAAGVAFYERTEVKDVLAYLRLLYNPKDRTAFLRAVNTPARGIGKSSQAKIADWAEWQSLDFIEACRRAAEVPGLTKRAVLAVQKFATLLNSLTQGKFEGVAPLIAELLKKTGYTESLQQGDRENDTQREDNVRELLTAAHDYDEQHPEERTLEGFLETTSLISDVDALDDLSGQVTLMTLHAAKGLEFPVVFVMAVEEKLLPHERSLNDDSPRGLEEERRLLFVGMTRAEERLYLTRTEIRDFRGQRYVSIPSSFLPEINLEQVYVESVGKNPPRHAEEMSNESHELGEDEGDVDFNPASFEQPASVEQEGKPAFSIRHTAEPDDEEPVTSRLGRKRPRPEAPDLATRLSHLQETGRLKSGSSLLGEAADPPAAAPTFRIGMSVRHPRYGVGTVIEASGTGRWQTVTVEFQPGESQKFVVHKSPLQPLGTGTS